MAEEFVPALGKHWLTGMYDVAIALMTRERTWRRGLIKLIEPADGDVIVDVGAGTGTLAIALKQRAPGARVIGIDPDRAVLEIARRKAARASVSVEWIEAFGDEVADVVGAGTVQKAVSSLVFHQCPPIVKGKILDSMRRVLRPGGRLSIADYGLQRTALMRLLFRQVQNLDGWDNTTPNAKGELPLYIARAGFAETEEIDVIPTPTGSISLYRAVAPREARRRSSS